MNILLLGGAIAVLAFAMHNLFNEWCIIKDCLGEDEPDYRDKYIGE